MRLCSCSLYHTRLTLCLDDTVSFRFKPLHNMDKESEREIAQTQRCQGSRRWESKLGIRAPVNREAAGTHSWPEDHLHLQRKGTGTHRCLDMKSRR